MSDNSQSRSLSRRKFGAILAATGAAVPSVAQSVAQQSVAQQSAQSTPPNPPVPPAPGNFRRPIAPDTPAFEGKLEFARKHVAPKVEPFPMSQVRLLPGSVYHHAQEWNRGYMARLAADRLLYTFRFNAGLPTGPVKPLGGWEQPENGQRSSELRGHFPGHFLSAAAQLAASGDAEAKAKGDYLVAELAKCQDKLGGKYLSAFPATWFDRLQKGERVWAPFYTIHKIMAGMFDMYRLAGNQQALRVLEGMAAWADEWTAPKSEEHMQQILTIEFGGIAETLYHLAAATNEDRWARAGDRFQKRSFINPLAARRDELRGLHVNTHIPQAIAAARRYEISGDTRFHDVADYFFYEVSTARSYVTEGTSNAEAWLTPPRRLAAECKLSANTAECCCAYNMLKLSRRLYGWNPAPAYFDYYERSLLNHRIGTIRPETGNTQYYLSLTPGAWKTFGTEDQTFWCCTGSGVEEYSKLNDSIYWHDGDGLYVNLFIASELDWPEKGFKLRQDTKFPEEANTSLTVTAARAGLLPIRLRIPAWLQSAPTVKLNGKALEASAAPGSYLTLNRTWKAGDKIEIPLPMHLRAESMPDDARMQAFLYGPLVLAGDLGGEGLTPTHIIGPNLRVGAPNTEQYGSPLGPTNTTGPVPEIEIPEFRAAGDDLGSWIKPAAQPMTWKTSGQKKDVTLVPLNGLFDRRYAVYWRVS
ncbi:MAG TPA: beta-L-arabinofuranosidase domain-containing protein [Candidatus Acidoferrales bacterium]|jgi:DUF1680 family protein|nr:beta-L-arabinofuranosidase domain-containing protein [Candidatus Acidoferrales bacterium]